MKKILLTFLLGAVLSFTAASQTKTLYDSPEILIETERLDCQGYIYGNFIFTNKTNNDITITYEVVMKHGGEISYKKDFERGTYKVTVNPNDTFTPICSSTLLLFLGKSDHKIFIVDYKLQNILTN